MSLDTRNAELDQKLEENPIDQQIAALARSDTSRRRQIRWLAVSLALDVLLTIGFGYTTLRANTAANKAETNTSAIIRSCETTNDSRKNNREIWDYVIELTANAPRSAQQEQDRAKFIEKLDMTFAPRDCSVIVKE